MKQKHSRLDIFDHKGKKHLGTMVFNAKNKPRLSLTRTTPDTEDLKTVWSSLHRMHKRLGPKPTYKRINADVLEALVHKDVYPGHKRYIHTAKRCLSGPKWGFKVKFAR